MAEEDLKNGLFPDLADSNSEPEDEREYRDAERRKSSRKHGPRRPPPAPESCLVGYPPVVATAATHKIFSSGTSDTLIDLVQEDAGPQHPHRSRGNGRAGVEVLWREDDFPSHPSGSTGNLPTCAEDEARRPE